MKSHLHRGLVFVLMASVALFATGCLPHLHKRNFTGGASKLMPVWPGANDHGAPWRELDRLIAMNLKYYEDISVFNGTYERHIPFEKNKDENTDEGVGKGPVLSGHWKIVASRKTNGELHVMKFVFPHDGLDDLEWPDYWVNTTDFTSITGLMVFTGEVVDDSLGSCGKCVFKEGAEVPPYVDEESVSERCYWLMDVQYCYDLDCKCWEPVQVADPVRPVEP